MIYLVVAAIFAVPIVFCTILGVIASAMRSSQLSRAEEQGRGVHP